jgi:spermidine dehydrogenase
MAEIGASEMFWPDGYCTWMQISDPLRVGEYSPEYHPDRPTLLSMYKYIYKPGLPPTDQMKLGRYELENKPFEEYEREIRSELNHALGPWGFDAAQDILAITVNRWGHGYNFFPPQPGRTPLNAAGPHPRGSPSGGFAPAGGLKTPAYEIGRARLGRISFAGADAGGTPWTQAAMEQAHRAAHEQLALS